MVSDNVWRVRVLGVLLLVGACNFSGGDTGEPQSIFDPGIGDGCSVEAPCRVGLECIDDKCTATGSSQEGSACQVTLECQAGLACQDGACLPAGDAETGDACVDDADCKPAQRCVLVGVSLQCAERGSGDVGDACSHAYECLSPLTCILNTCIPGPVIPPLGGPNVSCAAPARSGIRAFFEVPGASGAEADDFFRLPFPNDVRLTDRTLDLSGFPTAGDATLGYDAVQRYADALQEQAHGWGTYPTIIFRFSGRIASGSLAAEAERRPLRWVDVTPGAAEYGASAGLTWSLNGGRTSYVCHNWLALRRPVGKPLIPGHTYAVWLTTDVQDPRGEPITRAANLVSLLSAETPQDPPLKAAHAAYGAFRDYLAENAIDTESVLNATVITVDDTRSIMERLASAVAKAKPPSTSNWIKCSAGKTSPCPQADLERACGSGGPGYDEYHALVDLPIFQKGTPPYADPEAGGAIVFAQVRREKVCLALTLPTAAMPAAGWPLVIFAHGTGGSFRSHVRDDVAGALANLATAQEPLHFAVLGIDQVEHGPRRGESSETPANLFFNFANPAAAQGNPLQGAADQLSLLKLLSAFDISASQSGGAAIKVDRTKLVFFGHSQGATQGSLALPYASSLKAIVLAGNGASLMDSLLSKERPVNIAAAIPFALGDVDEKGHLVGGIRHPALSLLQHWIDPADPLNFARAATYGLPEGRSAVPLFQPYGLSDTYSPAVTMATYAIAAGLGLATHDSSVSESEPIGGKDELPLPVVGNATIHGKATTLVVREYGPPPGSDGHFVVFDVPAARADTLQFLARAVTGQLPAVGGE